MPPPAEGFASRFVLGPALRTQPDRRLVTLVRSGYETAFEEIVRRYGRPLGRYAAAIVGSRAEDVTQDAFSKALLALRRESDAEIELRPWLYRIVRNTALNDLRDRPPTAEELTETLESGSHSAAEDAERREEVAELMQRLRALPEPQRAAIVMRELEGLSHEEIAAALGMSGGAARQAIYRARRALRDGLGLLLPLPLLKALLSGGAAATGAELATGAAGVGSAAGAGVGIKAAAATVLVAGTVGAGVALNETDRRGETGPETTTPAGISRDSAPIPSSLAVPATSDSSGSGAGDNSGPGSGGRDDSDDRSGREDERDDDRSGHGRGGGDDHSARSGPSGDDDDPDADDDSSGPGPSGSPRSSGSRSGHGGGSRSNSGPGSGSGGSVSGSSGSSGPGPSTESGSGDDDFDDSVDLDDDSGSGSSGSGSEPNPLDDDSSGSGSGDDD